MALRPNPLLPTGAVASLDRLLGRLRQDVCQVKRRGVSRDAGGAPITSAYGVVDTLDCQVRAVNRAANEFVVGGRLTALADYEIVVSREADIREADRITVNSKTFEVANAPNEATHGLTLTVAVKLAA